MTYRTVCISLPILLVFFSGCVTTGILDSLARGSGIAAINIQTLRGQVVQPAVPGLARGDACAYNFLSLFAWGDSSVAAAKKKASILRVSTVDLDITNVLGIYGRLCTIVTGSTSATDEMIISSKQLVAQVSHSNDGQKTSQTKDGSSDVRLCNGNNLVIARRGEPHPRKIDCGQLFTTCDDQERAACLIRSCKQASEHIYDECKQVIGNGVMPLTKADFYAMCEQRKLNSEWSVCQINCFSTSKCNSSALRECYVVNDCSISSDYF